MTPSPVVASIGVYDGVHLGHVAVLDAAGEVARRAAARLAVFTFDEHPDGVVTPGAPPPLLAPASERVLLLRRAGAEEVRVLRFNDRLAAKSPERFLADHVFPWNRLAAMVVGYDFAMGRGRTGTTEVLRELGLRLGFSVHEIPSKELGGEAVSSSRVRAALARGEVEEAARLLGRPYRVTGRVIGGEGRGVALGFPTANLDLPLRKMTPARGVYAVRVTGSGLGGVPGVVNIGSRPTFGGGEETVEVHVIDRSGDWRGTVLSLDFASRVRDERKFNGPKELADQIGRDAERARNLLGGPRGADRH